jgi:hypothetical protein
MASNKKSVKNFLAMWDNQGLECIYDIDQELTEQQEWEKSKVWNTLQGVETPLRKSNIPLKQMILRAKVNSQRHYEIYQFAAQGLDIEDIKIAFEDDPQFMVNHIRKNGKKIFSERFETSKAVII